MISHPLDNPPKIKPPLTISKFEISLASVLGNLLICQFIYRQKKDGLLSGKSGFKARDFNPAKKNLELSSCLLVY